MTRAPLDNARVDLPGPRVGLVLGALSALQVFLAFGLQVVVLWRLGASSMVDAYLLAFTVPQLVSVVFLDTLRTIAVPEIARYASNVAESYASALMTWAMMLSAGGVVVLAGAGLGFASVLLGSTASELAFDLYLIGLLTIVGTTLTSVTAAYGQATGRLLTVAVASVVPYVVALPLLVLVIDHFGVTAVAWMQVFVLSAPGVILYWAIGPRSMRLRSPVPLEALARGVWIVSGGAAVSRSTFAVDRVLAAQLGPGAVTILDFGVRVNSALTRVINQGIVTPVVPALARAVAEEEREEARRVLGVGQKSVAVASSLMFLPVLVVAGGVWLYVNSVDDSLSVGSLSGADIRSMAFCVVGTMGIVLAGSLSHLYSNALFAERRAGLVTIATTVALVLGIGLRLIGARSAGLIGLALAVSVTFVVQAVGMGLMARRLVLGARESNSPGGAS